MKSLNNQAPHIFRSRRSYLDNRIDTFPEHHFYPAQHHQDMDDIEFPFQRASKPSHDYNTEFTNPKITNPEFINQEFTNPELTRPDFTNLGFTNTRRIPEAPQEALFTPLMLNRFKNTPLDIGLAPDGEDDPEIEDWEELLTRPLSPKLDLTATVPQELMKKTRGSLEGYLEFMELKDSGVLDKCLPPQK